MYQFQEKDPPPPPTSEQPGYNVLYNRCPISILNDDTLLEIFNNYRLEDEEGWNYQLGWCKLSHVCQKWRRLIYKSSFHLKMQIILTNDMPPLYMLAHLPPLPLVIDCRSTDPAEDNNDILHAMQQPDRIRRVFFEAPPPALEQLIVTIGELFPRLDELSLLSTTKSEGLSGLVLPRTFVAPNLRHLALHGVSLPTGLPILTSAFSLVTLKLTDIQAPGYFTPELLVTQLQHIPHLQELLIGFYTPLPPPSTEGELLRAPIMLTALPALRWLSFRGVVAYLEGLVSRISAPLLERFNVTLFYELTFTLPHLFEFIRKTEGFRHPIANVVFNGEAVAFVIGPRDQFIDGTFSLHISCKPFDWQIDSATQICSALAPVLSVVEQLTLECDGKSLPDDWQNEVDGIEAWHGILWPFSGVKILDIGHPLALEFSRGLESDNAGLIAVLLPELQELQALVTARQVTNAFATFIDARRVAGRPVHLRVTSFIPDDEPVIPDASVYQYPMPVGHLSVQSNFTLSSGTTDDSSIQNDYTLDPDEDLSYQNNHMLDPDEYLSIQNDYMLDPDEEPSIQNDYTLDPDEDPSIQNDYMSDPDEDSSIQNDYMLDPDEDPSIQNDHTLDPDEDPSIQNDHTLDPDEDPSIQNDYTLDPGEDPSIQNDYMSDPDEDSSIQNDYTLDPDEDLSYQNDHMSDPDEDSSIQSDYTSDPDEDSSYS
jgi:hypothetical protein